MDDHERLGISRSRFEELLEYFEERSHGGRAYRHLPGYRNDLERGTVLIDDTVVRGFPKIPRTLVLETGVPRQFEGTVAVEEKLDGYNVRIAPVGGEVLAFTRGGIVCPFTTHEVRTRLDLDPFFEDHPGLMVCAEVVGPENPYTPGEYPGVDSLAVRAFDLRDRETGAPLAVRERRARCEDYGFPQVPLHGFHDPDETDALRGIVAELDAAGREGIVVKSADGTRQLKYTTATANRGDLAFAFSLPFDYGQAFMFRRLIREAFQSVEWDESEAATRERAHDLGESILCPMVETIRAIEEGVVAGERHTVRSDPAVVEALLEHLRGQGLTLLVDEDRTEGEERVVTFRKRMQSTTDTVRAYLDGQIVRE